MKKKRRTLLITMLALISCLVLGVDRPVRAEDTSEEPIIQVITTGSVSGLQAQYTSLAEAFQDLQSCSQPTGSKVIFRFLVDYGRGDMPVLFAGQHDLTIDLDGHEVTVTQIETQAGLILTSSQSAVGCQTAAGEEAGHFYGSIGNSCVNFPDGLSIEGVAADIGNLNWMPDGGVTVRNANVMVLDNCFTEKLNMDSDSIITLTADNSVVHNYGKFSLEESLGAIREYLPKGYTINKQQLFPGAADRMNLILNPQGEPAQEVVLRYRRVSDGDVKVTLNPTSYVYDGQAKEPEVLATYADASLIRGEDYTVSYENNINAGEASAIITGLGTYHGTQTVKYEIQKAQQAAPTGLSVRKATEGKTDGVIQNVTTAMEYTRDQTSWTGVAGTTITGLGAGDYYVRYAETQNYYASPATKVTVEMQASKATESSTSDSSTSDNTTAENHTSEEASQDPQSEAASTAATTHPGNVKTGDEAPIASVAVIAITMIGAAVVIEGSRKKKY